MGWFKKGMPLIAVFIVLFFLTGCGAPPQHASREKITVVDQMGRTVEVPKKVERIVVLQMPFPSIIYALDGSGKRVVGMHPQPRKPWRKAFWRSWLLNIQGSFHRFRQRGF